MGGREREREGQREGMREEMEGKEDVGTVGLILFSQLRD